MQNNQPARRYEDRRSAARRGYGRRWRTFRLTFLAEHPLCAMCACQGRVSAATVVDHKRKHAGPGDPLLWDLENMQALCAPCHDSTKQQQDHKGWALGHGPDGWPLDPLHPVYIGRSRNVMQKLHAERSNKIIQKVRAG